MTTKPANAIPVLLYHDVARHAPNDRWTVTRDMLAAHLDAVLEAGLAALTASHLARRLFEDPQPARLCALTFDDGFASFAELAMPLLAERGLASTVYLTTGLLDQKGMLSRSVALDVYRAHDVEVGAHAIRHRHLDLLRLNEARVEVEGCRAGLAELCGEAPQTFAYPHGSYTPALRDIVRHAGYDSGYAVKDAFTHRNDHRYALARLTVTADTGADQIRDWLRGLAAPLSWRRQRLRTIAFRRVRALRAG